MDNPTYGEQLLQNLLQKLPADEFYSYSEPRIDHSVKTSRYPDFVIVWRNRGVICLEIKDWKKIYAEDQRTIVVKQQNSDRSEENPYETARDYTFHLKDRFLERRELMDESIGKKRLLFPIEPLVALTNQSRDKIDQLVEGNIFPENSIICADDLLSVENLKKALKRLHWTFQLKRPLSDNIINAIHKTLAVLEIRSKPNKNNRKGDKYGMVTEDQDAIIWSAIPYAEKGYKVGLVRGVAGSGKTIVLSKKANLLTDIRPDLKILVTAFNKDLSEDLKSRIIHKNSVDIYQFFELIKQILGNEYPQYWEYRGQKDPRSVKSWCKENFPDESNLLPLPIDFIAQEVSRRKELELDTNSKYKQDLEQRQSDLTDNDFEEICVIYSLYTEYQNDLKNSNQNYQDYEDTVILASRKVISPKSPFRKRYDIVMVDEAQDFSKIMFNVLRSMLKPGGYLFVCDDPLQTLWRDYSISDRGLQNPTKYYLQLPLRTTKEIADLAQSIFEIVPEIHAEDSNEIYPADTGDLLSVDMPYITQYSNSLVEEDQIINDINQKINSGIESFSIGVLTPLRSKEFQVKLEKLGVYYAHFNLMKGLEFNTVYIAKLDDLFYSPWNNRQIMRRTHYRKLFVAVTRARRELYLSHIKPLPEYIAPLANFCQTL